MSYFLYLFNPKKYLKTNQGALKLKKWAKLVYKKDNYTCAKCGYKVGGNLKIEAHHIYPKSKYPRKTFSLSNGVCLCEKCHRTSRDSYHSMYGVNGSKKQFKEWLYKTSSKRNLYLYRINYKIVMFILVLILLLWSI